MNTPPVVDLSTLIDTPEAMPPEAVAEMVEETSITHLLSLILALLVLLDEVQPGFKHSVCELASEIHDDLEGAES